MTLQCKLCFSNNTERLWFAMPPEAGEWWHCRDCGSDSATHDYDLAPYLDRDTFNAGMGWTNIEEFRNHFRPHCDWFGHHHRTDLPKDFLDIGCWHSAALDVMQSLGWSVHGFDVVEPPFMGPHITVRPYFHRWWWGYKFTAVLACEVFEHVLAPDLFLHEVHGCLRPGGLFQIQTPKPRDKYHGNPYQRNHLHLASTRQLRAMLDRAMFDVVDAREWDLGQSFLCRARG